MAVADNVNNHVAVKVASLAGKGHGAQEIGNHGNGEHSTVYGVCAGDGIALFVDCGAQQATVKQAVQRVARGEEINGGGVVLEIVDSMVHHDSVLLQIDRSFSAIGVYSACVDLSRAPCRAVNACLPHRHSYYITPGGQCQGVFGRLDKKSFSELEASNSAGSMYNLMKS